LKTKPTRKLKIYYGWWVLGAAVMAVVFNNGPSWSLGIVLTPMTEEFDWRVSQLLGVVTAAGLLGTVISPPLGRVVDRYGARIVISTSMLFFGIMLILTSQTRAMWHFYLFLGLGMAVAQSGVMRVGGPAIAANWFLRKRAIAFGAIFGGTAIAGMLFPPVTQAMVDAWGWRSAWAAMGILIVVVGTPITWAVIRRRPEDLGLYPDGANSPIPFQQDAPKKRWHRPLVTDVSWTLNEAIHTRTFWLLNVCMTLPGFAGGTVFLVMHAHFTEMGIDPTSAATFVSFYAFTALAAIPLWTALVQFFGVRSLLASYALFYGAGITIFASVGGSSDLLLYLGIIPLGIGVTGSGQLANQVWADYYGRQSIGTLIGVAGLFRILSMAGGPILAGGIHDLWGQYVPAFYLFAIFALVAAIGLFFAKPPTKTTDSIPKFISQGNEGT
jgi:MFS family permease